MGHFENPFKSMSTKLRKILVGDFSFKRIIRSILFIYFTFFIIGMFFARFVIFKPPEPTYDAKEKGIITFRGVESNKIAAVYFPAKTNNFTIFFCHGNAEDIGIRIPVFKALNYLGYGVFAFDYRGYGLSSGRPTVKNTYVDSESAFSYLTKNLGVPPDKIILHGQSLGGGIAIPLAVKHKVAGLIVESSFVTAFRVLTRIPIYPFDKYKNIDKIKNVHCPVLFIHGLKDRLISPWHGKKLFKAANEPKMSYWVKEAGHNDLIYVAQEKYFDKIMEFTTKIAIGELKSKSAENN